MDDSVRRSLGITISAISFIQLLLFIFLFLTQFTLEFMRATWISNWWTVAFTLPLFLSINGLIIVFQKKSLSTKRLIFLFIFPFT